MLIFLIGQILNSLLDVRDDLCKDFIYVFSVEFIFNFRENELSGLLLFYRLGIP